jgi:hypothetical protein
MVWSQELGVATAMDARVDSARQGARLLPRIGAGKHMGSQLARFASPALPGVAAGPGQRTWWPRLGGGGAAVCRSPVRTSVQRVRLSLAAGPIRRRDRGCAGCREARKVTTP